MNQYRRKPGRKEHSAAAFSKYRRENRAKCLITTARHRATVKGIPFTLSPEDIDRLQAVIDAGHCQVTGLPFDLDSGKAWNSPSIDRIDSNLGYTPENVRVTLYCVNVMANTWGVEKVVEIGEAIRGAQEERRFGFQNRLSARLKSMISLDCSLEYSLNWKDTQTESGMVIPRLVASPKKTNQSPWPTPQAHDKQGGKTQEQIQAMRLRSNAGVANLNEVCQLAPWPTPNAEEFGAVDMEKMEARRLACQERTGNGNGFGLTLGQAVAMNVAGWNTPNTDDRPSKNHGRNLGHQVEEHVPTSSWQTPTVVDAAGRDYVYPSGDHDNPFLTLPGQAKTCEPMAWATPNARDYKDSGENVNYEAVAKKGKLSGQAASVQPDSGTTAESSPAATARRGVSRLNPGFSLWLMGFPESWSLYSPGFASAEWARRTLAAYYASRAETEPDA